MRKNLYPSVEEILKRQGIKPEKVLVQFRVSPERAEELKQMARKLKMTQAKLLNAILDMVMINKRGLK